MGKSMNSASSPVVRIGSTFNAFVDNGLSVLAENRTGASAPCGSRVVGVVIAISLSSVGVTVECLKCNTSCAYYATVGGGQPNRLAKRIKIFFLFSKKDI